MSETNDWEKLIETEGEELSKNIIVKENKPTFVYNDNVPIPGTTVNFEDSITKGEITESTALEDLVYKSAMHKAKEESKQYADKQEQLRIRKQIIDMILYNESAAYYEKYHYTMDGKTKRRVKRIIEKNYDAGKYDYLKTTSNLNEP